MDYHDTPVGLPVLQVTRNGEGDLWLQDTKFNTIACADDTPELYRQFGAIRERCNQHDDLVKERDELIEAWGELMDDPKLQMGPAGTAAVYKMQAAKDDREVQRDYRNKNKANKDG